MPGKKSGPQLAGTRATLVDEQLRARASAFVATVGLSRARELLHASAETLEAACGRGNLTAATAARLVSSLDREEPLLARKAS